MVSRGQVAEVLASQPSGSCLGSEECLQRVCRETKALYVVLATLALDGPRFVLNARLIAASGAVVSAVDALAIEKDQLAPRTPQLQAAFKALFARLNLASVQSQRSVAQTAETDAPHSDAPVAAAAPPPQLPAAQAPVPSPPAMLVFAPPGRALPLTLIGAGAAVAIFGGALVGVSLSWNSTIREHTFDQARAAREGAQLPHDVGLAGLAIGGAVLGTGLVMLLLRSLGEPASGLVDAAQTPNVEVAGRF